MSFLIAGGALTVVSGLFGMGSAKRARRAANAEKKKQEAKLANLEKNRQAVVNPYSGVTDLSSMAKDLSGNLSNPYANLGVSTQAAEIQIEEADIALANTLDTLRATGASAGGATALAQAALQSKKGVSSSIEQQEAANEKAKAQGQADLERMKMTEQTRIQNTQISEGQRTQQADAAGKSFVFNATETRQNAQINRVAGLADRAANQEAQARADGNAALTGMLSGLGSLASAGMTNKSNLEIAKLG
jgi:hypothetical protein|tara:strand:+ start:372 stop:1112 length:741 start_codon:yes stop_codon:yes gene_type:complete